MKGCFLRFFCDGATHRSVRLCAGFAFLVLWQWWGLWRGFDAGGCIWTPVALADVHPGAVVLLLLIHYLCLLPLFCVVSVFGP